MWTKYGKSGNASRPTGGRYASQQGAATPVLTSVQAPHLLPKVLAIKGGRSSALHSITDWLRY